MIDQQAMTVLGRRLEQILLRTDVALQRHDDFFANRIDRRIGDLRKQLLEVVVDHPRLVAQAGERTVVAHRSDRITQLLDQRQQHELHRFGGVAEGLHARQQRFAIEAVRFTFGMQFSQANPLFFAAICRTARRAANVALQFLVGNQPPFFEVDQEHPARLQATLFFDDRWIDRQHADFAGHDHAVIVRDVVATRTQAVAVERGTDVLSVGERRSTPGHPTVPSSRRSTRRMPASLPASSRAFATLRGPSS